MSVELKSNEPVQIGNVRIHLNEVDTFSLLRDLLMQHEQINDVMSNTLKLQLDEPNKRIVLDVITVLTANTENSPLRNILEGIQKVFADGKIDVNDVPTIVKIITDVMNTNKEMFKGIKPTFDHLGVVMKVIIVGLCKMNVIKQTEQHQDLLLRIIDASLTLLATSVDISKINWSKCFCCC